MSISPITLIGFEKIQEELNDLIKNDREEIKIAISEARELGDLKENAEYHSAKEKQSLIEGKIMDLQRIIASSKIIDISQIKSDKIVFGASVTLFNVSKKISQTYQIVSDGEANMAMFKVSFNSPLGRTLIGKEEGDVIIVKAPKGDLEYEIESFEFI